MGILKWAAMAVTFVGLSACASFPSGTSVADYCANPQRAGEAVCQLSVEINGNRTALAETNMSLNEARAIANSALSAADRAQMTADAANRKADAALRRADAALRPDDLDCETRVLQQTNIGTCRPGYTVMSCTQTRFTYRSGGPSILREIDDKQCRFHDRVLEMRVRCCRSSQQSSRVEYVPAPELRGRPAPVQPRTDVPVGP